MKTGKAHELGAFINGAIDVFETIYEHEDREIGNLEMLKTGLEKSDFEFHYQEFFSELNDNIKCYPNIVTVDQYVSTCLVKFYHWNVFKEGLNNRVIAKNYELTFLLELKKNIEFYAKGISGLIGATFGEPSEKLKTYYSQIIQSLEVTVEETKVVTDIKDTEKEKEAGATFFFARFDFATWKAECDLLPEIADRITFIRNIKIDFRQWQLQQDHLVADSLHESSFFQTNKYYSNFLQLCDSELERYTHTQERNNDHHSDSTKTNTTIKNDPPSSELSTYVWKAHGIYFIELIASLYKEKVFERRDNKEINRKELIDFFLPLVGLKIKNIEETLHKATSRYDKTIFLDRLKKGFENFAEGKEEILRKRR